MLRAAAPSPASHDHGWLGRLQLRLGPRAGRTRVLERWHEGPLTLQRAFHPEPDGTAHVVLLHPPGGVVGGDRLDLEVALDAAGQALLTAPGATKVYRSAGATATITNRLDVAAAACLEYVPQEMVVFDGAKAELRTTLALRGDARALAWEVVCLGRPAAATTFERGRVGLRFDVRRDGDLVFAERGRIGGGDEALRAAWGLAGAAAFGTLVATHVAPDAVRDLLEPPAAATQVAGLLVVRALGRDGASVRRVFERVRHGVRAAWGRPALDPGIWRT